MKTIFISILLVCVSVFTEAQTNFVKNGDFERYDTCPALLDQLNFAKFWRPPIDSSCSHPAGEYNNACANIFRDLACHVPDNLYFHQYPHSGNGLIALVLYYDKTLPPPYDYPFEYRDYAQVRLYNTLKAGRVYCVSFWVNKSEAFCYAHNKIGAYLDDGSINTAVDSAGKEITSVIPQVYTNTIIKDTQNWVKIEGSFVAVGNENTITVGNFFPNSTMLLSSDDCIPGGFPQYSYYLFDDVSVVPVDEVANAGVDRWVEMGKQTQIGPVEDSTARGMDCKWYYKSKLIDSGNVITVSASSIKYAVDTYVVVQNVCGKTTRDTMLLRTVGAGMSTFATTENTFSISPNPSSGKFYISNASLRGGTTKQSEPLSIKVYDVLGRVVYEQSLILNKAQMPLELNLAKGTYIVELRTEDAVQRERIVISE
jgi:hypothetical protein